MLSSQGKPSDTEAIGNQLLTDTPSESLRDTPSESLRDTPSESLRDRQQIFELIERILSFEACLYHQILPYTIEDNKLLLGMVNLEDTAALDYVGNILYYMNCTMVTVAIAPDTHRNILSAYLNYKNTSQPAANLAQEHSAATIADSLASKPETSIVAQTKPDENSFQQADSPALLDLDNLSKATILFTSADKKTQESTSEERSPENLPVLLIPVPDLLLPVEQLATLQPKKLLAELLGRVLAGGIGRLYLERQPYEGRILWSDNGVLQSVLEKLPLSVFQGVLNELKRLTNIPVTTLAEAKQVEKECLYQENRLLLRLRVMPGMYGEEATLQVLRGAALKFHQQQQLARLSRDAIGISQQLSHKLHELQQRLVLNRNINPGQLKAFTALNRLLDDLDNQIKILTDA
ncbi:pilus assembly protein PilB [Hassallia byssoidea VB512170]|uniref:Pilus assembly protein PilB n=1 Tax=Hassallia byssoidea VB512170 TaxID=1304833 RepID=A0A846HML8_9CYAN|nr:type II secretory pathway, ATPase PulE/Tfp pilus assembly pathway, ATPase PilB [Hassalia byssoidea]NEU77051.1 pilus assembly protein PilB [Hassalia byssoidea VB512170]